MKIIDKKQILEKGEYSGKTFEYCMEKIGKKSILDIVEWYDVSDELLEEYGIGKDWKILLPTHGAGPTEEVINYETGEKKIGYGCYVNYVYFVNDILKDMEYWDFDIFPDGTWRCTNELGSFQVDLTGTFDKTKYNDMIKQMEEHSFHWTDELVVDEKYLDWYL